MKAECFVIQTLKKWIEIQEFCEEVKAEVKLHFI